ncbi:hypothetical protein V2W45_1376045 [Cenococcum geophilum]
MSMPLGASNHSPQTQIPSITAEKAWHTHGTLMTDLRRPKRPGGRLKAFCGPCQSRVGICKPRSTNCSSSLTSCLTAASDANLGAAL